MSIIYLIECKRDYDTVYKIGYSKCKPNSRASQLQTGNDGKLKVLYIFESLHERKVETALHALLSHKRGHGEWYKMDLADVQNFKPLCQKIENNLNILQDFFLP